MEPLVTIRQYFVWLGILPADESTTRRQKLAQTIFIRVVLIGPICGVAASLVFCWKYVSIDTGRSIFAILFAVAEFTVLYVALVGMFLLRHKNGSIFDNLATIYNDSEYFCFELLMETK